MDQFTYVVEIEGFGDNNGQVFLTTGNSPGLGAIRALPYLSDYPDITAVSFPPQGGFGESAGEVYFSAVDVGRQLSSLVRMGVVAETFLTAAVTDTATSWTVDDASALSVGDVVWSGPEAVEITNISSNTLTVTRAQLGTTGTALPAETSVYSSNPYIIGRGVKVIKCAHSESVDEGDEVARGVIDIVEAQGGRFTFAAKSAVALMQRLVPSRPTTLKVESSQAGRVRLSKIQGEWDGADGGAFFWNGSESFYVEQASNDFFDGTDGYVIKGKTPEAGTTVSLAVGLDSRRAPFVGNWGLLTWIGQLFFCKASPQDNGATPVTRLLPDGYGAGISGDLIDWTGITATGNQDSIASQLGDVLLTDFLIGPEPKPLSEILQPLLETYGIGITFQNGKITLGRIRKASGDYEVQELSGDDILNIESVVVRYEDRLNNPRSIVIKPRDGDFETTFEAIRYAIQDAASTGISSSTMDAAHAGGDSGQVYAFAVRQLWQLSAGVASLSMDVTSNKTYTVGGTVAITAPGLADLFAGERKFQSARFVITQVEPQTGDAEFQRLTLQRIGGAPTAGLLVPGGRITAVSSNTATVTPFQDYQVGDTCRLISEDLATQSAGTQTVVSVTSISASERDIELDGNFSGGLTTGEFLFVETRQNGVNYTIGNTYVFGEQGDDD